MKFKFPGLLKDAESIKNRVEFVGTDVITFVDVSKNDAIDDETFASFLFSLFSDAQCKYIDLSETKAGQRCAEAIGVLSMYCTSTLKLRKLNLQFQALMDFVEKFDQGVKAAENRESRLTELDLSGNGNVCLNLLGNCGQLTYLDLSEVKLEGTILQHHLGLHSKIQTLKLRKCDISSENLTHVAKIDSITDLDFSCNPLADVDPEVLAQIARLPQLGVLYCGNCRLGPGATKALFVAIGDRPLKGDLEGDTPGELNTFLPDHFEKLKHKGLAKGAAPAFDSRLSGTGKQILVPMTEQEYQEYQAWLEQKKKVVVPSAAFVGTASGAWTLPPGYVYRGPPPGPNHARA